MRATAKALITFAALLFLTAGLAAPPAHAQGKRAWESRFDAVLPLLGHRNWILIVDSAYPLQASSGVETLETNGDQIEVIRTVLGRLDRSIHVRPNVYLDAELPFVTEKDAPGVTAYRKALKTVLGDRPIQSLPHEQLLAKVDETGKNYRILVLKTRMTVPYTSVFLQLDCKYWSAAAEQQLRQAMRRSTQK